MVAHFYLPRETCSDVAPASSRGYLDTRAMINCQQNIVCERPPKKMTSLLLYPNIQKTIKQISTPILHIFASSLAGYSVLDGFVEDE